MSGRPLRVYFNYRTVEGPWGGANAFLRGLKRAFLRTGRVEVVDDQNAPFDVFFLNQLNRGPGRARWQGRVTSPGEIARIASSGSGSRWRSLRAAIAGRPPASGTPIVCRLVNLVQHAYGVQSPMDEKLLRALQFTDVDVFQSEYIRERVLCSRIRETRLPPHL